MHQLPQQQYSGCRVLVTGASGFIGEHLCRQLNDDGALVTGVYLTHKPALQGVNWRQCNLTHQQSVAELVHAIQPDVVFHLASYVEGNRGLDAVYPTLQNNLLATINLLTACHQADCVTRIVLTHSQEEPTASEHECIPSSPYAASKFAASAYARMFHSLYNLPIVIARVFMVYGPHQKNLKKLVPYTILEGLGGYSPSISSGERRIDWIYIDDLIHGLLALGHKDGVNGDTIDLGSGIFFTVKQVVKEILQQINPSLEAHFGAIPNRAMEQERLANTVRTKEKINWHTTTSLPMGLAKTIAWYGKQADTLNKNSESHRDAK